MFYWSTKVTCKYDNAKSYVNIKIYAQKTKLKINKAKVVVGVYLFPEKKDGFIIPSMKCYQRNG